MYSNDNAMVLFELILFLEPSCGHVLFSVHTTVLLTSNNGNILLCYDFVAYYEYRQVLTMSEDSVTTPFWIEFDADCVA